MEKLESFIYSGEPIAIVQIVDLNIEGVDLDMTDLVLSCAKCGGVDTIEQFSFKSFGGTTEGYDHCTKCGAMFSWSDISAIL